MEREEERERDKRELKVMVVARQQGANPEERSIEAAHRFVKSVKIFMTVIRKNAQTMKKKKMGVKNKKSYYAMLSGSFSYRCM